MEEYAAKIADQEALQVSLIDKYEEDYRSALVAIDEEAKGLIQDGREMEALASSAERVQGSRFRGSRF